MALSVSAIILIAFISYKRERENKGQKEENQRTKWDNEDWGILIVGSLFGPPVLEGIIMTLYSLLDWVN